MCSCDEVIRYAFMHNHNLASIYMFGIDMFEFFVYENSDSSYMQVILAIGTKLQHVIASLALEHERSGPFLGAILKPRDELFWFHKPKLLLYVIHLVLFQVSVHQASKTQLKHLSSLIITMSLNRPTRPFFLCSRLQ